MNEPANKPNTTQEAILEALKDARRTHDFEMAKLDREKKWLYGGVMVIIIFTGIIILKGLI